MVKTLQEQKHICGMTGDGVNDAPALKKADIGIAVSDSTDAAQSASDTFLTDPGLSVIIHAVLTSRSIFQRMKDYTSWFINSSEKRSPIPDFLKIFLLWLTLQGPLPQRSYRNDSTLKANTLIVCTKAVWTTPSKENVIEVGVK
ncbi:hypothetical protein R1sor_008735 [Riccia sorocarpa]|uniref:Uncharacterized protein n=1 Tax=Riccia sorocarpa TaxID=122646 RepID=A0ABD3HXQ5_9MARC